MDSALRLEVDGVKEFSPISESTGVADAGKFIATNANGQLDESLLPDGIGLNVRVCPASEVLASGDFVNFWTDSGTLKVRKADASAGFAKLADGYVKANVAMNANATVYEDGTNTALTGLTVNTRYYLSATTPGGVVSTAPTTAGHVRQPLGKALSTTELPVKFEEPILRA